MFAEGSVSTPQDPVMPSQEPSSDAKSDEVDVPPDDAEDTHGGRTPTAKQ